MIMNNDMKVNEFLEQCENNGNIHEYEKLEKQKQELEESLKNYELTYEQEEGLQNKLEATKNGLQVLEQKMTPEEQQLMKEKKELIDNSKHSIEFLAASTLIINGEKQGTKAGEGILDSKEQYAHLCAAIAGNEKLMQEVHESFSDKKEADAVLRKFNDNVSHPAIEKSLELEKGDSEITVGELIQSNKESQQLMEQMGIDSEGEHIFSATNIKFATYVQNGIIKELAPEEEMSKEQLKNLAENIKDDGYSDRGDIDFICKVQNNLTEEQTNIVVEAVVMGNEVKIEKHDAKTGGLDQSALTSGEVQQAEKVTGEEIKPDDTTKVDNSHKGRNSFDYGDR